jgi:hypothetical protein
LLRVDVLGARQASFHSRLIEQPTALGWGHRLKVVEGVADRVEAQLSGEANKPGARTGAAGYSGSDSLTAFESGQRRPPVVEQRFSVLLRVPGQSAEKPMGSGEARAMARCRS